MSEPVRVVAGVFLDGDRVLACRRAPGKTDAGRWEFPGGKVEPGESEREALARELAEELAVDVAVGRLVDRTVTGSIELAVYEVEPFPAAGADLSRGSAAADLSRGSTAADPSRWSTAAEGRDGDRPGYPVSSTDHDELRWVRLAEVGSLDWADADRPGVLKLIAWC